MNHNSDQRKIDNDSGKMNRRDIFQRLIARPLLVLFWLAVGIACISLVILVFYPRFNSPIALSSNLKNGPKVFRTKIPEEINDAANIHRGKIPAVSQPVKKALPSQPTIAVPGQDEPKKETDLHAPIEPKIANVTKPPVAKVVPSQPVIALPERGDSKQKTKPRLPTESPTINEAKPLLASALPSQQTFAQTEKSEPPQETEPHLPVESQVKMESMVPVVVSPPEPNEQLDNADPRQAEARPQPQKEDFKEKTEERTIHGEAWLLSQKSSHYTIQIMGVRKEALLFDFVESAQLLKENEIAYYRTTFKDKPWFRLLYGVYATKKEAQAAADAFPPKIRKSSPWIRRLSGAQKSIRKNSAQ